MGRLQLGDGASFVERCRECSDGKAGASREGRGAWRAPSGSGGVRVSRPLLCGAGPLADGSLTPEAWTSVAHSFEVGGYKLVGYA